MQKLGKLWRKQIKFFPGNFHEQMLRRGKNQVQNLWGQKGVKEKKREGWWRRPAVATKYTAGIYSPDIGNTDTG